MGTLTVIGVALAAALWCLLRILSPILQRLGDRVAAWLLPDGQSATFRLAIGLAVLARLVSPSTILFLLVREGRSLVPTLIFYRSPNTWKGPEAVVGELREDFASGRTVEDPVHFVWPLLPIAAAARLRNAGQLLVGAAVKLVWLPLTLAGPVIGGLIRGRLAVIGLCSLSLAGFTGVAMLGALGVFLVGFGLNVGSRGQFGGVGRFAAYTWLSPVAAALALAALCSSLALYPLAELGLHGTYVVVALAGTMLAYFVTGLVRQNAIDALVDLILWKPGSTTKRHRLRVTRLHLAGELAAKVIETAGLYGIAAFAGFSAFEIGPPVVWVTAGLVATIALCYSWASGQVALILRPPACIGDDVPGRGTDMLAGRALPTPYSPMPPR